MTEAQSAGLRDDKLAADASRALENLNASVARFASIQRIKFADATVSLVTLTELTEARGRMIQAQAVVSDLITQLRNHLRVVQLELADLLIAAPQSAPETVAPYLSKFSDREAEFRRAQATAAPILDRQRTGFARLLHAAKDRQETHEAEHIVQSAEHDMDSARQALASAIGPQVKVPGADGLVRRLAQLSQELALAEATLTGAREPLAELETELQLREHEKAAVGFDRPGLLADLHAHGPKTIESPPVVLKKGEVATVVVGARLARHRSRSRFVGGSHGVSIPVGHTGIRYRVGAFQGQRLSEDYIAIVDTGQFVVTNRRIVFVGTVKVVQVPLEKIVHVEPYSDALEIGGDGKEAMDLFLVGSPQYVLAYLNYAQQHMG